MKKIVIILCVTVLFASCEMFDAMDTMAEFIETSAEYIYDEATE